MGVMNGDIFCWVPGLEYVTGSVLYIKLGCGCGCVILLLPILEILRLLMLLGLAAGCSMISTLLNYTCSCLDLLLKCELVMLGFMGCWFI